MSIVRGRAPSGRRVDPRIELVAAYCGRIIVIAIVAVAALWLLRELRVPAAAVVISLLVSRILAPVAGWLRRHRWRPGHAAAGASLVFVVGLAAVVGVVAPAIADDAGSLGPTVEQAVDDIEDWLVDEAPFDVDRATVDDLRRRAGSGLENLLRVSDGAVLERATLVAEVLATLLLATILTFFMLRDGNRFVAWATTTVRPTRRAVARDAADTAWSTLGAYLRGVAILGAVEAVIIGLTLLLTGAGLVAPVMLLTFVLAFIPIVGALVAGVVAVLVALVTGGVVTALVVAAVALVVQQLDNDLLAPVIYGRALALHPVVVLLSVTVGGALFGLVGTILSVPVTAVAVSVVKQVRDGNRARASSDLEV